MRLSLKLKSRTKNDIFGKQKDENAEVNLPAAGVNPASPTRKPLQTLPSQHHQNGSHRPSPVKSYLPKTLSASSVDISPPTKTVLPLPAETRAIKKERKRRNKPQQKHKLAPADSSRSTSSTVELADEEDVSATASAIKSINSSEGRNRRPGAIITVTAPPGKLGLVVDSHPTHGVPIVFSVLDDSIIHGRVRPGDRLTMVNRTDLTFLKPADVAKALHETRGGTRRLRLFRPDVVEEDIAKFDMSFQKTYRGAYK